MPDRAEYQPLVQDVDDNNSEGDVAEVLPSPVTASRRGLRRPHRPGHIDLGKLDNAFKRCVRNVMLALCAAVLLTPLSDGPSPLHRKSSGRRKWRIIRERKSGIACLDLKSIQCPQMTFPYVLRERLPFLY